MEMVTLEIDGQIMVKSGGLFKKGDKICFSTDKNEFYLAPFSGKVLAIFQNMDSTSFLVKTDNV